MSPPTVTVRWVQSMESAPTQVSLLRVSCDASMRSNCPSNLHLHKPLLPGDAEMIQIAAQDCDQWFKDLGQRIEMASRSIAAPEILVRGEEATTVRASGDGSLQNVGLCVGAKIQRPESCQRLDTEKAHN